MKTLVLTVERKPIEIPWDGGTLQVEELGLRLPFARKPGNLRAMAASGDDAIYVEKYLSNIRHIEIQVLADGANVLHLGEPVDLDAVGLRDDPQRAAVRARDRRAVGALGDQRQRLRDGLAGRELDGGVEHQVSRLHELHDVGDDGRRDVLGDHRQPATARDRLGHPLAGDGRHVGDDQRQGGAGAVAGGEVDVVPAGHRGVPRDHEDVVVGQVVGRGDRVEELHVAPV